MYWIEARLWANKWRTTMKNKSKYWRNIIAFWWTRTRSWPKHARSTWLRLNRLLNWGRKYCSWSRNWMLPTLTHKTLPFCEWMIVYNSHLLVILLDYNLFHIVYEPNTSFWQSLSLQQHLAEHFQLLRPTYFLFLQRHQSYMEVFIELKDLIQILLLHLWTSNTHLALVLGIQDLIDHDVMDVYSELSKLLNESFSLVHWQKLRNTYCYKGSFVWVFHMLVYYLWSLTHFLHFAEQLIHCLVKLLFWAENVAHVLE